jgi:hypothetical protein
MAPLRDDRLRHHRRPLPLAEGAAPPSGHWPRPSRRTVAGRRSRSSSSNRKRREVSPTTPMGAVSSSGCVRRRSTSSSPSRRVRSFVRRSSRRPPSGVSTSTTRRSPTTGGCSPIFWQLYHGEMQSVLTIHRMVEDLDKGDILVQAPTPIGPQTTQEQLMRLTKRRSAAVLWTTLVGDDSRGCRNATAPGRGGELLHLANPGGSAGTAPPGETSAVTGDARRSPPGGAGTDTNDTRHRRGVPHATPAGGHVHRR